MDVTFVVPSVPHPVGGVLVLYELANGLRRRGHEVNVVHAPWIGGRIARVDEVSWFPFADGIRHLVVDDLTARRLPSADVVVRSEEPLPRRAGLPVTVVQGLGVLPRRAEDALLASGGPILCASRWLVAAGRAAGVPGHRLVRVPPGIDAAFGVDAPIAGRRPVVSMLVHRHPVKGTELGLEALALVRARVPELEVVGFGVHRTRALVPKWMRFVRRPNRSRLARDVYGRSRVFLCPSRVEGFGMTSTEAMACGAALVTTANGGSDEYARHLRTALVSGSGDAASLANAVEWLLRHDPARVAIARAGARSVRRFSWAASVDRLEVFLRRYVADPDRYLGAPGRPFAPARSRSARVSSPSAPSGRRRRRR